MKDVKRMSPEVFDHPLLISINRLLRESLGIGMAILFPREEGWGFALPPGTREVAPGFCRLIQSREVGAVSCRMCHVLMSIAACGRGAREHRCHAGVSVLVVPASRGQERVSAVLSTCMCLPGVRQDAWKVIRNRAKALGLDVDQLKAASEKIPELTAKQAKLAQSIMAVAAEAVRELTARAMSKGRNVALPAGMPDHAFTTSVESMVKGSAPARPERVNKGKPVTRKRKVSVLVDTVVQLVSEKPHMPFTVAEIASAARMTPNYFSMLFQKQTRQSFMNFLTNRRIELGKTLLRDLTLNIQEVSLKCGYPDAGYFARRFRQKTGMTPSEWRESR